MFVLEGKFYW